jgi:hypothetical protein
MTVEELLKEIGNKVFTPSEIDVIIKLIEEQEPKQCSETELLNRTYSL